MTVVDLKIKYPKVFKLLSDANIRSIHYSDTKITYKFYDSGKTHTINFAAIDELEKMLP